MSHQHASQSKDISLRVANLDCDNDAAKLKRSLKNTPGITRLKVYPKAAKVTLSFNQQEVGLEQVKEKLAAIGFPTQEGLNMPAQVSPWRNPKVITSLSGGILLLVGWLLGFSSAPANISLILYYLAILTGGYYFGREALEELVLERKIGIELLMSIAAITATIMGQPLEGAILVFLYSISEAAEGYTEEKTRSAVKALMNLAPKTALVRRGGLEQQVPVENLVIGDIFIVKPGESIATDGEIIAGFSSINEAPVTGESVPVEKQIGSPVFAGSINGAGALEVRVSKTFADNTISRIIHMVEEAQEKKGKGQRFIERFGARYSPLVLLAGILIAVVPPLLFGAPWNTWLLRATVFIVAAAPCALVISIPITMVATLGTAARQGVLIKGGVYVEELAKVQVVALDKTGTLTKGEPEVTDVLALPGGPSVAELLAAVAGLERYSEHPLARAIVNYADAKGIVPKDVKNFRALAGAGASAQVGEQNLYVGNPELFSGKLGIALGKAHEKIEQLQNEGKTVVIIGDEKLPWGLIAIRDQIRPKAKAAIKALHDVGIGKVVMLTGDNKRTARAIAAELGIDEVYADLKPEDKLTKVNELTERFGHVAMVGDGVNDAPALAEATAGIAMGAAGTDVAMETADVVLMADDLEKLVYSLKLSKRNQRVVNQNLALSTIVIGGLVIGAVAGWFTLPIAVLGHEISEFVVIGSGLRMLRS